MIKTTNDLKDAITKITQCSCDCGWVCGCVCFKMGIWEFLILREKIIPFRPKETLEEYREIRWQSGTKEKREADRIMRYDYKNMPDILDSCSMILNRVWETIVMNNVCPKTNYYITVHILLENIGRQDIEEYIRLKYIDFLHIVRNIRNPK